MSRKRAVVVLLIAVTGLSLWGSRNARAGVQLGSGFPIASLSEDQIAPAVAYNDQRQEYLVVWNNDRPGLDDIYAQRVAPTGALIGSWFSVAAQNVERILPDIAYNSTRNEYLVVWQEQVASGSAIRGQRLSAVGIKLGAPIEFCTSDTSIANRYRPAVAYAAHEDKYLVVWERRVTGGVGTDIQAQAVSTIGTPDATCHLVAQSSWIASHERPALAYNHSRNEYLVVWQQLSAIDYDIYGRRVQGNGTPMGTAPEAIAGYSGDDANPAVAAIPTEPHQGKYLVVFESPNYFPPVTNIYAVRLTGELKSEGASIWLSQMQITDWTPAVAGQESNQRYLVTWSRNGGIIAREVSIEGDILSDNPSSSGLASEPDVAAGPTGSFFVVYQEKSSVGDDDIYGWLWGTRIYLPVVIRH